MRVFYRRILSVISRFRVRKYKKITVVCLGFRAHQFCSRFMALLRDMRLKKRTVKTAMKVSAAEGTCSLSALVSVDGQFFFASMTNYHE
jgi:hypothetical protein